MSQPHASPVPIVPAVQAASPAPPPITLTLTEQLTEAQQSADAACLREAQAYLEPFAETARQQLPLYRALCDEAEPFLERARREDTSLFAALGAPSHLWQAFDQERQHVFEIAKVIGFAEKALAKLPSLSGEACRKNQFHIQTGRWPAPVEILRDRLLTVAPPVDGPRRHLDNLKDLHARLGGWLAGHKATGGPLRPLTTTTKPREAEE